jgi:hypothetical protein
MVHGVHILVPITDSIQKKLPRQGTYPIDLEAVVALGLGVVGDWEEIIILQLKVRAAG